MKLKTLGKIQIGVAVFFFITTLLANIFVYFSLNDIMMTGFIPGVMRIETDNASRLATFGFFSLFTEIIIAADIIFLLIISMLIIDGAAMLAKD